MENNKDQVVKDRDYFLDEVSKEYGYLDYNVCCTKNSDNDGDEIKLNATERWYKYQLEEKDIQIDSHTLKFLNYIQENQILTTTIAEREKEAKFLNEKINEYFATIEEQKKEIEAYRAAGFRYCDSCGGTIFKSEGRCPECFS